MGPTYDSTLLEHFFCSCPLEQSLIQVPKSQGRGGTSFCTAHLHLRPSQPERKMLSWSLLAPQPYLVYFSVFSGKIRNNSRYFKQKIEYRKVFIDLLESWSHRLSSRNQNTRELTHQRSYSPCCPREGGKLGQRY